MPLQPADGNTCTVQVKVIVIKPKGLAHPLLAEEE